MKALQLHYTSCRRGQSGNAGFQTRTLTQGIRPDEQREIERRGVYRPPRDARQDPSPEEIARELPRAFRSYTLESGRPAITRSSYVGRDYSGRWGNFFAHSLVLENGQIPALWAIDLYEWEGWKEGLSAEEDSEESPPSLPMADLTGVPPAESFRFAELRDFLQEEPGRRDLLARMGRAVLLGRETSRAVVVRDTPVHGLYWIACLQKLFPAPHAAILSTSTYQDDPRGCAAINATTGTTDFTFDEAERRFRFYEFDLTTGTHSEVPGAEDDYPAVAARWMAEDPGRLQGFYEFLRLFDHSEPEAALISAVHLFELSQAIGRAPGGEQLTRMIQFASLHATTEGRVRLLEVLGQASDLSGGLPRAEDYEPLIRFLASGARASGRPEHRALAFRAWTSLVRHHLLAGGRGLATAEKTWGHLQDTSYAAELAALVLAEPAGNERLSALPLEILVFLLRVIWTCLELQRRTPAWEQPELGPLLTAVAQRSDDVAMTSQAVLATIPPKAEPLLALIGRLHEAHVQAGRDSRKVFMGLGRALGHCLAAMDAAAATAIRRQLEDRKAWDLLYGEWLDLVERTEDPLAAFTRYRSTVFAAHPRYRETCLHWIADSLLGRLSADSHPEAALEWLRNGDVDRFPPELAGRCIAAANLAVPLDPDDRAGEETAQLVAAAARSHETALLPNRPLLRDVLTTVRTPKATLSSFRLKEIRDSVVALQESDHAAFAEGFLTEALERATNKSEHQQLLTAVAGSRPALLEKPYHSFFKAKHKLPWPESLHAALRFWLAFERRGDGGLGELEPVGQRGLLLALEQLAPVDLAKIDGKLRQARIDDRATDRWMEIQKALEKRRRNPWNRLLRVFGRT